MAEFVKALVNQEECAANTNYLLPPIDTVHTVLFMSALNR